ncbi:Transposase DDE domain protein (plasmid) [Streptomyces sp. YIM 121038]|uniref:NF041680 family putative transposase n=1 Tax=Streptomyces sp. YIM 121038 TaxID=2136401 RepID=UPI0011644188|nr:NF041680 family putative transposase [Streptomyces sp. YIM 121038]QCX82419.1 Transposase DDE domain protein [Streptomyces sp. YIM 121038]
MSLLHHDVTREPFGLLSAFRAELYASLTSRADSLFELTDAMLCADGPVKTLVGLALAPEHQRGHGALYAGLNQGRLDVDRLRRALVSVPLPKAADGRLVLAVDVTPWLRPDADTAPDRCFCHTYGYGDNKHQMIPGWPYSVIAALETGRTSWTAVLDAVRLGPGADVAAVTTSQIREVVERLITAGQWREGDPDVLVVVDAGYDAPRLAHLLAGLPVEILGRLRSDRVMRRPAPSRKEFHQANPLGGRPPKHGGEFVFGDPATWGTEQAITITDTRLYGKATARAWDRLHPRLTRRCAWIDHTAELPLIEGTVIRLQVEHLPSGGEPKPVWLWWSKTGATAADTDRCWQVFLRRFDVEHMFRFWKQTLGWTAPRLRSPEAADRWTWLVLAAHAQLRLVRPLVKDLRHPWEKPAPPERLTPARVRRGFRNLRPTAASPAGAPKPSHPGPGRPVGSRNRRSATRHDVGKVLATGERYQRPAHHKLGTKPRRVTAAG